MQICMVGISITLYALLYLLEAQLDVKRILIIKHGALGDIIQALDGFSSVRKGHMDAHITLLTTPPFAHFCSLMPFFDAIEVDKRAKPWNIANILRMRAFFHAGWERVYDFQMSNRSSQYLRYLMPKNVEAVGVAEGISHPFDNALDVNNRARIVRAAMRGGCAEVAADMSWIPVSKNEKLGRYAVILAGCSLAKPEKRWGSEGFSILASDLIKHGITPVLAGTIADLEAATAIKSRVAGVVDKIGATNLVELADLLRGASLVVGNDTGPVFLAARLNVPTVMVMSAHTNEIMSAPYGTRVAWLKRENINDIKPAEVLAKSLSLISEG